MKVYPEYKHTSVDYYGKIPLSWGTVPLKYVCYMKGRIGWQGLKQSEFTGSGPYLITGMNFKDGKMNWEKCYHISQERYDEAPEIHVREGDVLITKDGTIGKLLFMDYLPGPTSLNSHLLILRPLNNIFYGKFLYYLLQSDSFLRYVDTVKTGTTFFGITQAAMGNFRMQVFENSEQRAIADFLDAKTTQVDDLITKKQRQIELLQEHRIALINQAVTKGLNPDAPMKDSGIEWLGEVPAHWEMAQLHHLALKNKHAFVDGPFGSNLKNEEYVDNGVPLIQLHNIGIGEHKIHNLRFITEQKSIELEKHQATPGDIVIAKMAEPVARAAQVSDEYPKFVIVADCMKLSPNPEKVNIKFLVYLLNSDYLRTQAELSATGTTRVRIGLTNTKKLKIALPHLTEQRAITDFLDRRTVEIDNLMDKIGTQITCYQEYRTALISAAVTGKIDVRAEGD